MKGRESRGVDGERRTESREGEGRGGERREQRQEAWRGRERWGEEERRGEERGESLFRDFIPWFENRCSDHRTVAETAGNMRSAQSKGELTVTPPKLEQASIPHFLQHKSPISPSPLEKRKRRPGCNELYLPCEYQAVLPSSAKLSKVGNILLLP